MSLLRVLWATLRELVALVVEDGVTFVAGALGLVATYVVAHHVAGGHRWAGFGLLAVVWVGLAVSFVRASRR